jgi:hypothetical protein
MATAQHIAQGAPAGLASMLAPRDDAWQLEGGPLTSSGWRAASAHQFDRLGVRLPATAAGVLDVGVSRVERLQLHVTLVDASPVPAEVDRGRVVYAGAWPSSDAIVVASDTTFEELVLLHDAGAPTELAWAITLPSGITGARDDGRGGLLWLDAAGQAELRTPRPFVLDAAGVKVDADVRFAQGRLVVAYDASGLTFPALLDPAIESAFWEQEHPAVEPPARYQAAMAFDSARAVSVLFGGTSSTALGDTWEWNGTTWTQRCMAAPCSTTTPSARPGAAMSFDGVAAASILFGGGEPGQEQNDTWSWNGTAWTPLCNAGPCMPPTARTQATMAFYSGSGAAVLFGGSVSSGCFGTIYDGDTWTWNGTLWQSSSPGTSPPARAGAGMVYDPVRDVALLFGGSGNYPSTILGDTWAWNGTKATWTQLCDQAPCAGPPARNDLGMAFDAVPGNTVMFGGNTGGPQLDDTWQWNGTAWTQMGGPAGPGARDQVAMAYDTARARVVLFGGSAGGTALAETWEYHSHGAACTADTQCDTGHCVDGVCCESVCGTCQSCDQAASLLPGPPPPGPIATPGVCSPVTNGPDGDSCTGGMTCNAEGQCKAAPGRSCSAPTDCASGSCIDGCCDGLTPCIPADAGADASPGNQADGGEQGSAGAPGGKGGGCGCRAAGEDGAGGRSPAGPLGAFGFAMAMAARRARARRGRPSFRAGLVATSTVTIGAVAASCSLVTPLDQLSAEWPPDASITVPRDATAEQDAAPEAGQDAAPDAVGTPPSNPALWSERFGDSQDQYVYAVTTSSAGDIFIAGAFAGSIDFGGGIALASTGGKNAFVAMLDSTGHAQWARSFGDVPDAGSYDKLAFGVAVDAADEVFVCGEFAGSLVAGSTTLTSAGGFDAFVVKLNPMGSVLWAQALSGPGDQAALGIAVDSPGNSVVEGSFEGKLTVSSTTLVSRGGFDGFTARFVSNGNLYWAIPFGGAADQIGTGVVLTDAGTTVATGYFAGQANVGTDVEAGVVTSAGGFDVASYEMVTASGATVGSTGYGDPSNQYGYAIAADAIGAGHIALAGPFQGSITFGTTPTLQSAGLDDIFVAKLGLTGAAQWSARFGDPEDQIAYGTALDLGGNVLVAGSLQGSATLGTTTVASAGGNDAVLAKLDPDGKPLWIERFGDPNDQVATAVTTVLDNGQYDVVLVGNFEGQIDLGNGPLQSQGGYDFFVAVLGP